MAGSGRIGPKTKFSGEAPITGSSPELGLGRLRSKVLGAKGLISGTNFMKNGQEQGESRALPAVHFVGLYSGVLSMNPVWFWVLSGSVTRLGED